MTLREEIRRIVIQCCLTESRTDEILKLFEQKIDEKRKILDNTNATEFYAKIQVLEDLKQELNEESS